MRESYLNRPRNPRWLLRAGCCLAYTSAMARLILASLGFSLIAPIAAVAQVKISVSPLHSKSYLEIHAKVEDTGNRPITFCIEVGQTSPKGGGEIEATPSPFWVQRNDNGKWGTLLIGPDVGSFRAAQLLEAGKSLDFPFRLSATGKMRLRLNYWRGSIPSLDCHAPPKGSKLVTSAVFTIE